MESLVVSNTSGIESPWSIGMNLRKYGNFRFTGQVLFSILTNICILLLDENVLFISVTILNPYVQNSYFLDFF